MTPLASTATPMPIWEYEADKMFARCSGEAMKADCKTEAELPSPTFSPSARQQQTAWGRFGVCASVCEAAMRAACRRATATRSLLTDSPGNPAEALALFVIDTRLALESARAPRAEATVAVIATTIARAAIMLRVAPRRAGTRAVVSTTRRPPMNDDFRYLAATWLGLPMNGANYFSVPAAPAACFVLPTNLPVELAADHEALYLVGALDDLQGLRFS